MRETTANLTLSNELDTRSFHRSKLLYNFCFVSVYWMAIYLECHLIFYSLHGANGNDQIIRLEMKCAVCNDTRCIDSVGHRYELACCTAMPLSTLRSCALWCHLPNGNNGHLTHNRCNCWPDCTVAIFKWPNDHRTTTLPREPSSSVAFDALIIENSARTGPCISLRATQTS